MLCGTASRFWTFAFYRMGVGVGEEILSPSAYSIIQQIMPANMRAQGSALYLFVINLIGLGLGPSAVAWCTDYVFQDPNKVNLSLMWVGTFFGLLSAGLLYFGSKHYQSTLSYLEAYNEKQMA